MPRLLKLAALVAAFLFLAPIVAALAHDWYTGTHDPVTGGQCCGGQDCRKLVVEPGVLEPIPEGYRLRLTAEQAKKINPLRNLPVDTIIPESRIQPSEDGNFHVCIPGYPSPGMRADFYCFWAPGST